MNNSYFNDWKKIPDIDEYEIEEFVDSNTEERCLNVEIQDILDLNCSHADQEKISQEKQSIIDEYLSDDMQSAIGIENLENPHMTIQKIKAIWGSFCSDKILVFWWVHLAKEYMTTEKIKTTERISTTKIKYIGGENIAEQYFTNNILSLFCDWRMEIEKIKHIGWKSLASEFFTIEKILHIRDIMSITFVKAFTWEFFAREDVTVEVINYLTDYTNPHDLKKILKWDNATLLIWRVNDNLSRMKWSTR